MPINFTVGNVIVCDDVRREMTGKDILIGVYPDGINAAQIPGVITLAFWAELIPTATGTLDVELQIELPDATKPVKVSLTANIEQIARFPAIIPPFPYSITTEGHVKLLARTLGADDWIEIKRVEILHRPAPPLSRVFPDILKRNSGK